MKLYHENSSIFSQSCLLLIKHLNLQIEVEDHEPHDEQFINDINPIFRVPVFIDDELVLTESRAIMTYLIENLQPGNSLYSKDLKKRALIDQRLFYDAAVVVPIFMELIVSDFRNYDDLMMNSNSFQRPIITEKKKEVHQKSKDAFLAVIRVLEGLLANNDYFAGNEMSIADFSILPSVAIASVSENSIFDSISKKILPLFIEIGIKLEAIFSSERVV